MAATKVPCLVYTRGKEGRFLIVVGDLQHSFTGGRLSASTQSYLDTFPFLFVAWCRYIGKRLSGALRPDSRKCHKILAEF